MLSNRNTKLGVLVLAICIGLGGYLYLGNLNSQDNSSTEPSIPAEVKTGNVLLESSVSNLNTANSSAEETSRLVENGNDFAFEIYSELAKEGKNTFISPYSLRTALSMTYEGAKEETAKEIREVLNLPKEDSVRRSAFADFEKQLNTDRTVELKTANALWPQENYPFRKSFIDVLRDYYLARVEALDYEGNREKARQRINEWAENHTEGKIEELISSVPPLTRLILTNAVYFKGDWLISFDKSKTQEEQFNLPDGSSAQTLMMQFSENNIRENTFHYIETSNLKALKLFYSSKKMSMTFLLPKNESRGADWIKNNITIDKFRTIQNELEKKEMEEIKIPKFKFKTKYGESLKKGLEDLGVNSAFDPSKANFSGMENSASEDLYIKKIVQKAYIKVNEKGTEAAAATGVMAGTTGIEPSKPTFVADHPFMFVIKDEKTGSILFMGSLVNP